MESNKDKFDTNGFSLVELLVYIGIFGVASVFLIGILLTITKIQTRQISINEINQQLTFVSNTIRGLIQESSLVEIPTGTATTSLTLRMASSSRDSTLIFSSGTAVYLTEGTSSPIVLTDSNINVDNFKVTKYEGDGGTSLVQIDMTFTYNSSSTAVPFGRSLRTGVTRISAATFDASVSPNSNNVYDLGSTSYNWRHAYFGGNVGIGVTAPTSIVRLNVLGNIGFTSSTYGLILRSANNTCFLLGVSNVGAITTSTSDCSPNAN